MSSEMTWRRAIDTVLAASGTALHSHEIAERIVAGGYLTSLGATPAATVKRHITSSIKREGDASPYILVAPGVFGLRVPAPTTSMSPQPSAVEVGAEGVEEPHPIVSSFGMSWRRDAVLWHATPRLLGVQQTGSTPVDFCQQLGIYLLYDGRAVVYVGRTTDRPLGRRLFEHTLDRMSACWDRFSWFGLLPVLESGQLEVLPATYPATKLILALEAILTEALMSPRNRKRGDDLAAVEFTQAIDPELEKSVL